MNRAAKIIISVGLLIVAAAIAAEWGRQNVKPAVAHKASSAQVMDLISTLDHASESAVAPYDKDGVEHYATMMGYAADSLARWKSSCPEQEPLLDKLGGVVYGLRQAKEKMTYAFTVNHPVSSPREISERTALQQRDELSKLRELALASLPGRP